MSTTAIAHIVDAFFRRWPIYVALLLGTVIVGVLSVVLPDDEYQSTGSVFVDSQSLVAQQSGVRDGGIGGFLSPAQYTSQEMSGLISTEVFMEASLVLSGVDLSSDPRLRAAQIGQLRSSVTTSVASENLIAVSVSTPDAELSFRVVEGIIEQFVQFQIDVDIAESDASEEFFASLVQDYERDLAEAQSAVFASVEGVSDLEQLRPDKQLEVDRLLEAESQAERRYQSALANLEDARLATLQTETDVRQTYSVFDPPVIPVRPTNTFFDSLVRIVTFVILGVGLATIWPLLFAALNNSVVFPDDLDLDPSDPGLIAVLPLVRKKELRLDVEGLTPTDMQTPETIDASLAGRTITFIPEGVSKFANSDLQPALAAAEAPVSNGEADVASSDDLGPVTTEIAAATIAAAVTSAEDATILANGPDSIPDVCETLDEGDLHDDESAAAHEELESAMVIDGYRILDLGSDQLDQMSTEVEVKPNGVDTQVNRSGEHTGSENDEA